MSEIDVHMAAEQPGGEVGEERTEQIPAQERHGMALGEDRSALADLVLNGHNAALRETLPAGTGPLFVP